MKRRNRKGQSMVEYGIGIGCVAAVCMLVLGGLGHASADIVRQVLVNINDADDQSADPGTVFTNGVSGQSNAPWKLQ
ncbi:MAG: hypothetical protein KGS72_26845 [Cyanobacteria bacterium REEB67]|nr:hypothetical protein [Cyanobacteria bacterium REEB67]